MKEITNLKKLRLNVKQREYAGLAYRQIRKNGVALIQLPTGQGKTLIALKVVAEILSHSKRPRPIILVTRKALDNDDLFRRALRGEPIKDDNPWIRDATKAGGLVNLHRGSKPKIGNIKCWSAKNLKEGLPQRAVVIIDEIHRFQSFLRDTAVNAYKKKPGKSCSLSQQRKFIFLSATPINPTRISVKEERGYLDVDEEQALEDKYIKTGYLNLYKAIIGLSSLHWSKKKELLVFLEKGATNNLDLNEFAKDLQKVMKILSPVPGPDVLMTLGPKGKEPFIPNLKEKKPSDYTSTVYGLMKFHEAIVKKCDLYYCAERMALAGVKAKRGTDSVGFATLKKVFAKKGLFHYQPNAPYEEGTLRALRVLESRNREIRGLLSGKIDNLYSFLRTVWRNHSNKSHKWKVLIYCAHRGSVAALAAELEKRFYHDGIVCSCSDAHSKIYGKHGAKRVVWDTEGYPKTDERQSIIEGNLKNEFCEEHGHKKCGDKKGRCPRGFVLVTSDRLSESIDLHRHCQIMIHYDLDWSPLRMIQRYGRLWRLEKPTVRPSRPAVFHMAQPGSIDEEILWRLEQRWERLHKLGLGLDTVKIESAIGTRLY